MSQRKEEHPSEEYCKYEKKKRFYSFFVGSRFLIFLESDVYEVESCEDNRREAFRSEDDDDCEDS